MGDETAAIDRPTAPPRRRLSRWKFILFALVPALVLLAAAEIVVRVAEWANPALQSLPLPEEQQGLLEPDPDLFWRLAANQSRPYRNDPAGYATNRLGLRCGEVPAEKDADEFRILSLGESTTYGFGITNRETYSYQLEEILNRESDGSTHYRVINAGLPAYSSFQSLLYLELRGFDLQPDLVLFYHEINDYLPTSLRMSSNNELGLMLTDAELHASLRGTLGRQLTAHSALFRFIRYQMARRKLRLLEDAQATVDPNAIGLDDISVSRLVDTVQNASVDVNEQALPTRVSPEERRANLAKLQTLCRQRGVELVVIHPSYKDSTPHECLLTEFCRDHNVTLFDAQPSLHPKEPTEDDFFIDDMHPGPALNHRLAVDLAEFLQAEGLVPEDAARGDMSGE